MKICRLGPEIVVINGLEITWQWHWITYHVNCTLIAYKRAKDRQHRSAKFFANLFKNICQCSTCFSHSFEPVSKQDFCPYRRPQPLPASYHTNTSMNLPTEMRREVWSHLDMVSERPKLILVAFLSDYLWSPRWTLPLSLWLWWALPASPLPIHPRRKENSFRPLMSRKYPFFDKNSIFCNKKNGSKKKLYLAMNRLNSWMICCPL